MGWWGGGSQDHRRRKEWPSANLSEAAVALHLLWPGTYGWAAHETQDAQLCLNFRYTTNGSLVVDVQYFHLLNLAAPASQLPWSQVSAPHGGQRAQLKPQSLHIPPWLETLQDSEALSDLGPGPSQPISYPSAMLGKCSPKKKKVNKT